MQANPTPWRASPSGAAEPGDRMALATLAELDSAAPVFDAVLVAELDGSIVAAVTVTAPRWPTPSGPRTGSSSSCAARPPHGCSGRLRR